MTFHFTDPEGRRLELDSDTDLDGHPVVTVRARGQFASVPVHVPVDRVEEVIAGLRDTARQAARQAAGHTPDNRYTAALHAMGVTPEPQQP